MRPLRVRRATSAARGEEGRRPGPTPAWRGAGQQSRQRHDRDLVHAPRGAPLRWTAHRDRKGRVGAVRTRGHELPFAPAGVWMASGQERSAADKLAQPPSSTDTTARSHSLSKGSCNRGFPSSGFTKRFNWCGPKGPSYCYSRRSLRSVRQPPSKRKLERQRNVRSSQQVPVVVKLSSRLLGGRYTYLPPDRDHAANRGLSEVGDAGFEPATSAV